MLKALEGKTQNWKFRMGVMGVFSLLTISAVVGGRWLCSSPELSEAIGSEVLVNTYELDDITEDALILGQPTWNVEMKTPKVQNIETSDPLFFCVDDCCEKLKNGGINDYTFLLYLPNYFRSHCSAPTDESTIKLVASGSDAWIGDLTKVFGDNVLLNSQPLVLSTQSSDELNGISAKRGVSFKKQADGQWHFDEDIPFDWFPFAWNVKVVTSKMEKAIDPLYFCVDDCCEELDNEGIDDYEGYVPDYFFSNCGPPNDESSIKLVSSGGDAWIGHLETVFGQNVHHSLQPLVLSTQPSDEIDGIAAKRGVSFKKQADGEWHYADDVPFDYLVWNVEPTTTEAATYCWVCVDDCGDDNYYNRGHYYHRLLECKASVSEQMEILKEVNERLRLLSRFLDLNAPYPWDDLPFTTSDPTFCVDDCCEKLENNGEDNEYGRIYHFVLECGAHLHEVVDLSKKQKMQIGFYENCRKVELTTSDMAMAGTDDSLLFCVDDCCEKLNRIGDDNYERGEADHFLSHCDRPTDVSTLKLVASGSDAWMGYLNVVDNQPVEHTLQPLVLSTQSTDEIAGIQAKHGVTFKKQADGEWHYAEDVPFDYFVWNVELTTTDVSKAAMDGSLRFCVDDCCEKLNNNGEDNYERGRIDHFRSDCRAPTYASTLKLIATNGDGWMGALQNVYGTDVKFHSLVLSTQSSDKIDGNNAKRGATFLWADGHWHWHSDVPY